MELRDLRIALRRHWLAAFVAFAVCVLTGVYVASTVEKTYQATATLSVQPNATTSGGGQGGVSAAGFLIPDILERLRSTPYRDQARVALEAADPAVADARLTVSSSVETGTGIVRVTVEAKRPAAAIAWANQIAEVAAGDVSAEDGFIAVEVIQPATRAKLATSADQKTLLLSSIVLGLLAAVFVALVASRTRRALDPTLEVRERLHVPVLATIPFVRKLRRNALRPLMRAKSVPDLEEAFRQLRTAVELRLVRERPETIAVTSYTAGEGKTTVTVGLGTALASVGHDVVIIDADLRRPALHTALGVPMGDDGLAEWARHDRRPELHRTDIEHLGILPAGTPDRHPADVVALALSRALPEYAQPGRLVLLDAPPILGAAETPLILNAATHVIVVVDASSSRIPELSGVLGELEARGIRVLGAVVNRAKKWRADKADYYAFVTPRAAPTNGHATVPAAGAPSSRSSTTSSG